MVKCHTGALRSTYESSFGCQIFLQFVDGIAEHILLDERLSPIPAHCDQLMGYISWCQVFLQFVAGIAEHILLDERLSAIPAHCDQLMNPIA